MNRDEVIAMAHAASQGRIWWTVDELEFLERFAAQVATKESETCARFLEETDICGDAVMDELAAAIRARHAPESHFKQTSLT